MKSPLFMVILFLLFSSLNAGENENPEYEIIQKFLLFQISDNKVRIHEIINIDSDRWNLPKQFNFTENIPDKAETLQFPNSSELKLSGNSVTGLVNSETNEITEITYTYFLENLEENFRFESNYFIKKLDIYLALRIGIELNDPNLIFAGIAKFEENEFLHYKAENIEENYIIEPDIVKIKDELVSRDSRISTNSPSFHSTGHIRLWYQTPFKKVNPHIFTLIISVLLITVVYLIIRTNIKEAAAIRQQSHGNDLLFNTLYLEKKKILANILNLEKELIGEKINKNSYNIEREKLKTQLIKINLKLNKIVNSDQEDLYDSF